MGAIKDLFRFLKQRGKWILAPVIIVMVILGALLIYAGGTAVAPFIYSLF